MSHNSATSLTVAYREFLKGGAIQLQSIVLSGKFFSSGKKSLQFESVSVLSIFIPEIPVISKKRSSL